MGGNKAFDFLLQVLICNLDIVGFFFKLFVYNTWIDISQIKKKSVHLPE